MPGPVFEVPVELMIVVYDVYTFIYIPTPSLAFPVLFIMLL